ncbi:MAG: DUF1289 domain-containing protein [Parvularculaceae bacterium]|nr:DUF1289 domain-containing protein [Parvularculaceae bacterium]
MLTPCIALCRLRKGICVGCHRTRKQIAEWENYTIKQKLRIMNKLYTWEQLKDKKGNLIMQFAIYSPVGEFIEQMSDRSEVEEKTEKYNKELNGYEYHKD